MSSPVLATKTGTEPGTKIGLGIHLKRAFPFAMAAAIWFSPVPAGLTSQI